MAPFFCSPEAGHAIRKPEAMYTESAYRIMEMLRD